LITHGYQNNRSAQTNDLEPKTVVHLSLHRFK
jgi:hypothetical protein